MPQPDPQVPGARPGINARLSVAGYGQHLGRVLEVGYDVRVGAQEEEARARRAFYPLHVLSPSFGLVFQHLSHGEREAFNEWLGGYMRLVTGNATVSGYMRVEVPGRRFARNAVARGPLTYGDQVGAITYLSAVEFLGASRPISGVGQLDVGGVSRYYPPTGDLIDAPHYYPSGTQRSGEAGLEGAIYDDRPDGSNDEQSMRESYQRARDQGLIPRAYSYERFRILASA